MSVQDFLGVVKMPKAVIIGTAAQFTIMPLVGFALAKGMGFADDIGAGIILIGSCSSGWPPMSWCTSPAPIWLCR
jgi:BASS family bile acid:Na+ symporter